MHRSACFASLWLYHHHAGFCGERKAFSSGEILFKCRGKTFVHRRCINFPVVKFKCCSIGNVEYIPLTPEPGSAQPELRVGERILPLFPLSLVVQPSATVPLHIFEMRYRLLFNRIKDGDKLFGIVLYNKNNDSVARYGCMMELVRFEPLPDGRMLTVNVGKERFRVNRIISDKPYITALVAPVEDERESCDDTVFSLGESVWTQLNQVLTLSNKLYGKSVQWSEDLRRLSPDSNSSRDWHRLVMFSHKVSQVLDIPVQDQQLLLQTQSTRARFQHQLEMLEQARKFLAAQLAINDALDKRSF